MAAKMIKYILVIGLLLLVGYNSVYIKKLDAYKAERNVEKFDANAYADNYLNKLTPLLQKSIPLSELLILLRNQPAKAFDAHSNALGIGNIKYFLTQGQGKVTAINESSWTVALSDTNHTSISMATEFIYGNAIRDASGLVDLKDFTSTADLNNVSAAINAKVRNEILPPLKTNIKAGDAIAFSGALELNQQHLDLKKIEIVPINITILQ